MTTLTLAELRLLNQLRRRQVRMSQLRDERHEAAMDLIDKGLAVIIYHHEERVEVGMLGATLAGVRLTTEDME